MRYARWGKAGVSAMRIPSGSLDAVRYATLPSYFCDAIQLAASAWMWGFSAMMKETNTMAATGNGCIENLCRGEPRHYGPATGVALDPTRSFAFPPQCDLGLCLFRNFAAQPRLHHVAETKRPSIVDRGQRFRVATAFACNLRQQNKGRSRFGRNTLVAAEQQMLNLANIEAASQAIALSLAHASQTFDWRSRRSSSIDRQV